VPLAVIRGFNLYADIPCHRGANELQCVTSISFINWLIFASFCFLNFLVPWSHIVLQCDTSHVPMGGTLVKYHCNVSWVIKCAIGKLLITDFN
jgi:hypothetical protein